MERRRKKRRRRRRRRDSTSQLGACIKLALIKQDNQLGTCRTAGPLARDTCKKVGWMDGRIEEKDGEGGEAGEGRWRRRRKRRKRKDGVGVSVYMYVPFGYVFVIRVSFEKSKSDYKETWVKAAIEVLSYVKWAKVTHQGQRS